MLNERNKTILITRPQGDLTVKYLEEWSKIIIETAKEKMAVVLDLKGVRANREEFEKIVRKKKPDFIMLNGHGSYDCVTGQYQSDLVVKDVNHEMLCGIVYALSCRSAKTLGQAAIEANARAYIGYDEDFIFYYDKDKIYHPLEDKSAKLFLEPSNQVAISLLKGHSAAEASYNSKKYFARNIAKLSSSSGGSKDKSGFISALYWNFTHQTCLGDGEATI